MAFKGTKHGAILAGPGEGWEVVANLKYQAMIRAGLGCCVSGLVAGFASQFSDASKQLLGKRSIAPLAVEIDEFAGIFLEVV